MEAPVLQVVVAGGAAHVRHAVAEGLRQRPNIAVVGVLDTVLSPDQSAEHVMVLDVSADGPVDGVLSTRELDVLRCLARGLTNAAIGGELYVSTETVKTHVRNVLRKLGVSGRHEAVERAAGMGLLHREVGHAFWTKPASAGRSTTTAAHTNGPR